MADNWLEKYKTEILEEASKLIHRLEVLGFDSLSEEHLEEIDNELNTRWDKKGKEN